jgi:hypothetical protein
MWRGLGYPLLLPVPPCFFSFALAVLVVGGFLPPFPAALLGCRGGFPVGAFALFCCVGGFLMALSSSAVVAAPLSFVPSAASLGAVAVVPVPGFSSGAVPVSSELLPGSGDFVVWFGGRARPLVCRAAAFGGVVPAALREAVSSAGVAGSRVFPVVALFGSRPASGFFCGVSLEPVAAPGSVAPAAGSFA